MREKQILGPKESPLVTKVGSSELHNLSYLNVFLQQKKRNYYLCNYTKLSTRNTAALKCESRKNKCWVPWKPPLKAMVYDNFNFLCYWSHRLHNYLDMLTPMTKLDKMVKFHLILIKMATILDLFYCILSRGAPVTKYFFNYFFTEISINTWNLAQHSTFLQFVSYFRYFGPKKKTEKGYFFSNFRFLWEIIDIIFDVITILKKIELCYAKLHVRD